MRPRQSAPAASGTSSKNSNKRAPVAEIRPLAQSGVLAETAVPDAEFKSAAGQFSEKQLADLTIAIGLMNAYNRMAISFRAMPEAARHA